MTRERVAPEWRRGGPCVTRFTEGEKKMHFCDVHHSLCRAPTYTAPIRL
jgi:hypothetical protein